MRLNQMWPSKTLDARDLHAFCPDGCVVTIEAIDYKVYDNGGDNEVAYYLYTSEFKKPFRLNKTNAITIGDQLGSEETEDWRGKHIKIRPLMKVVPDRNGGGRKKEIWVIDVDLVPARTPPTLPATKQDITGVSSSHQPPHRPQLGQPIGGAEGAASAMSPIGIETAAKMWSALKERGKTFGDFLQHAKTIGADHLVAGKMPHEFPVAAIVPMRAFVGMFPKTSAPATPEQIAQIKASWMPPAPQTEVVNRQTGEVITPGQPAAGAGGVVPGTDIPLDDIPF